MASKPTKGQVEVRDGEIVVDDPFAERLPAITPDPDGFYADADWIRVECDWPALQPREGFSKIWAEIDTSLTFQEAIAIPLEPGRSRLDLFAHLVHRVRAWNVREFDPVTNTFVPVPPPTEIGKAAFLRIKPVIVEWLAFTIREYTLNGGPNRKNGATASEPGHDGASDEH